MANEIRFTATLSCENGTLKHFFRTDELLADQAAARVYDAVHDIGTSEEDISLGDISTEGMAVLYNLDVTNYVQWGPKSGSMVGLGRMKPSGFPAMLHLEPGTIIRMVANNATCKVRIIVYED